MSSSIIAFTITLRVLSLIMYVPVASRTDSGIFVRLEISTKIKLEESIQTIYLVLSWYQ